MSAHSPDSTPNQPVQRRAWRGHPDKSAGAVRHRWQKGWTAQSHEAQRQHPARHHTRRRLHLILALSCFLGLFAALFYTILQAPRRTPLIALTAQSYDEPLAANAWIAEDLASLQALDGTTLECANIAFDGPVHQALSQLDAALQQAARQHVRNIVVYISMHGAIDQQERPCLLTGASSPWDCSTWLPLAQILSPINAHADRHDCQVLVVLDAHRRQTAAAWAVSSQSFTARVQSLMDTSNYARLSILTAADEGQIAYVSPQLRRSVFAYHFQLGLAGLADEQGDGDGVVSVSELAEYARRQVHQWSMTNRGVVQTPRLLQSPPRDFAVAASLNGMALHQLVTRTPGDPTSTSPLTARILEDMWARYWRVAAQSQLLRFAPERHQAWQRQLLRWEHLAHAGRAYEREYQELSERLSMEFDSLERQLQRNTARPRSVVDAWRATAAVPLVLPRLRPCDLSAAEYFGVLPDHQVTECEQRLAQCALASESSQLQASAERLAEDPLVARLVEPHLLRVLARYQVAESWPDPTAMQDVFRCQQLARETVLLRGATAVGPGDERTHAWTRELLDEADTQLRRAQDLLLAGQQAGQAQLTSACTAAEALYRQAQQRQQSISRAYAVRDQVLVELSQLWRWYADPARPPAAVVAVPPSLERNEETYVRVWLPVLRNVQELARQLQAVATGTTPATDAQVLHIEKLTEQLAKDGPNTNDSWGHLRQAFAEHCEQFRKCPASGGVVQQLNRLLEVGLLTAEQRAMLYDRRNQLAAELHTAYTARTGQPALPAVAQANKTTEEAAAYATTLTAESAAFLAWWNSVPVTPTWAWFAAGMPSDPNAAASESGVASDGDPAAHPWARWEHDAAHVRSYLKQLAGRPAERWQREDTAWPVSETMRWEAEARLVGSWPAARFIEDAVSTRRRYDLQRILLWYSERSLRDFWGPSAPHLPPYFQQACTDWLDSAAAMATVSDMEQRRLRVAHAAEQAQQLIALRPEQNSLDDVSQQPLAIRVHVDRAPQDQVELLANTLQGDVACVVFSKQPTWGRVAGLQLVRTPTAGQDCNVFGLFEPLRNPTLQLRGTIAPGGGRDMELAAVFRGHEFGFPLSHDPTHSIEIVTRTAPRDAASVTVYRQSPSVGSLLMLLDCSNSMQRALTPDAGPGNLEQTRQALLSLTEELTARGQLHAGVTAYGHRVGFGKLSGKVRVQPAYQAHVEDTLRPQQDIQAIINWGPVVSADLPIWQRRLQPLVGWGQSPHYGALLNALNQLGQVAAASGGSSAEAVVLFTDGSQFAPSAESAAEQDTVTWQELLGAVEQSGTPIHCVLVGERSAADLERLNELAQRSGGSLRTVEEIDALVATLVQVAGSETFGVTLEPSDNGHAGLAVSRGADGKTRDGSLPQAVSPSVPSQEAPLGHAIEVPHIGAEPQTALVTAGAAQQSIVLQGGERMELEYDAIEKKLFAPAYRRRLASTAPLLLGPAQQSAGVQAYVHRPLRTGPDVHFTVSFQAPDRQFVRWPAVVWVEIRPVGPTAEILPTYVFCDAPLAAQLPVPAVECVAPHWPSFADQAEVRVWVAPDQPAPWLEIALADCLTDDDALRGQLDGPHGGQITVVAHALTGTLEGFHVDVTERQRQAGEHVPALVQLLVDGRAAAPRIVRTYHPAAGVVSHSFQFAAPEREPVLQTGQIRVILRDTLQQQGWHLGTGQPVLVDVSAADNYLSNAP